MKKFMTNKQICSILYCVINGYGILNLPKNAADSGGTGGWITIFIVMLLSIVIVYMISYIQHKYENQTIYEYSQKLVGKFITRIISCIFILYFFLWYTMIIRIYCEKIRLTILPNTKPIYSSMLFYIVATYAITKGLKTVVSICEIYSIINFMFSILFIIILFGEGNTINLMPLFVKEDIPIYIKSIPEMVPAFLGMGILFIIPMNKLNNKHICRYTSLAVIVIGMIYIFMVEATISVIGVESIVNMNASMFSVAKGIDVGYLEFSRRLDGLYIFAWSLNIVCGATLWGSATCTLISKLVKNKSYIFIVTSVSLISFFIGRIPKSLEMVKLIIKYLSYGGIALCLIISITFLIIGNTKRYEKNI